MTSTFYAHLAAAALLGWLPTLAIAQGADTVTVGNQNKRASGMVVKLEAGDTACTMTLKDDKGVAFDELADFPICEQKLIGKRVALVYKLASVMADECGGNPDCKKTRRVAIVSTATVVTTGANPIANAVVNPTADTAQTSFCTTQETVVFACRSGAKLVSVCASKDASATRGYLQYRFGKPDSKEPLEMMLPDGQPLPGASANGGSVAFAAGGGAWLRFRKGDTGYVAYTGIGNWGPKGETREKQGLLVERAGKRIANLKCTGKLTSELGPAWFEKTGVKAGEQEFDFPD